QLPLYFNLSHAENLLYIAVSGESEVGVDIEKVKLRRRLEGLAERSFSPRDLAHFCSIHPHEQAQVFYHLWVQKEAVVKCLGRGIAHGLSSFTVAPYPEQRCKVEALASASERLKQIEVQKLLCPPFFEGAVATNLSDFAVRYFGDEEAS